jgi:hypothetical protein
MRLIEELEQYNSGVFSDPNIMYHKEIDCASDKSAEGVQTVDWVL